MRRFWPFLLLLLAVACDTAAVSEPETDSLEPLFAANPAANPAVKRVVGIVRQYVSPPASRSFSYSASEFADGTVEGTWQINNEYSDANFDGYVTCVTIAGNQAWVGGVTAEGGANGFAPGTEVGFWAEDNGVGANVDPDRLSLLYPLGSPHAWATADDWCRDMPTSCSTCEIPLELTDIASGSIRIECVGEDCVASCPTGTCADLGMTDCGAYQIVHEGNPGFPANVVRGGCSYLTDDWNCGACGNVCREGEYCSVEGGAPQCTYNCRTWPEPTFDCDGLSEDYCESTLGCLYPECTFDAECGGYACLGEHQGPLGYGGTCADAWYGGCRDDLDCVDPYRCYDVDVATGLGVCEWRS